MRASLGDSALAIEILGDPEVWLRMLSDDPRTGTVRHENGALVLRYWGGPEEASELLARLVGAGVRVVSLSRRKDSLEELFLFGFEKPWRDSGCPPGVTKYPFTCSS